MDSEIFNDQDQIISDQESISSLQDDQPAVNTSPLAQ
jgi:hypothetical protein